MERLKKLWKLFFIFLKIGTFTFGGGLAMLPLIEREVVTKQKWVDEFEILDIFAVSQSVPGVIAVNTSVFIGNKVAGILGAIAAALGVILPAFLSILLVLLILSGFSEYLIVQKFFAGIRAASAALILLAAIKLSKAAVKTKLGILIAVAAFLLIVVFNISVVWAVLLGAVAGLASHLQSIRRKQP